MSEYKDPLTDHNYDGIQEYDNQLPRWWVYLFVISVIFGVAYLYWLHIGDHGKSTFEAYHATYEKEQARLEDLEAQKPTKTEEEMKALLTNDEMLTQGEQIFQERCASCHLEDGGGLVGPNLTDDYWIHGSKMLEIRHIVMEGVPAKGMVPWKSILSDEEVDAVTAFVKSLHGTTPKNPKPPQGDLIKE